MTIWPVTLLHFIGTLDHLVRSGRYNGVGASRYTIHFPLLWLRYLSLSAFHVKAIYRSNDGKLLSITMWVAGMHCMLNSLMYSILTFDFIQPGVFTCIILLDHQSPALNGRHDDSMWPEACMAHGARWKMKHKIPPKFQQTLPLTTFFRSVGENRNEKKEKKTKQKRVNEYEACKEWTDCFWYKKMPQF